MFSTACLPCESTKHPVLTIMSVWKVISSGWAGCQREGEKKPDEHPENFNRFFQLHQAVVCYSIFPCQCPFNICPSSSTWWIRSSPLLFIPCSCVQNKFPNQVRILGEQLSSASNENKCGVLNLQRRPIFFRHLHVRVASNCQVQYPLSDCTHTMQRFDSDPKRVLKLLH